MENMGILEAKRADFDDLLTNIAICCRDENYIRFGL